VAAAGSDRERGAGKKPFETAGIAALIRATRLKPGANQTGVREKPYAVSDAAHR
jgi:hypothetical protein